MYAVVRVRGSVDVPEKIQDTLKMLRLDRVNRCVLVPDSPDFKGMLKKAGNFITWGEISPKTLETLIYKRGFIKNKKIEQKESKSIAGKIMKEKTVRVAKIRPVFRLSPPSKGYRSIKKRFPKGDLGYRGEKINDLLKRMI